MWNARHTSKRPIMQFAILNEMDTIVFVNLTVLELYDRSFIIMLCFHCLLAIFDLGFNESQ